MNNNKNISKSIMTENEIIQILKDNKEKGIVFGFLPDEVITFALKYKKRLKLLDKEGFWISYYLDEDSEISIHEVVCLPEDFELKNKSEGGWVEFMITNGVFTAKIECDEGESYTEDFHWWDWQGFLTKSFDYDMNYTTFGGWQYESNGYWLTELQMIDEKGQFTTLTDYNEGKPVIPIKIRFWKNVK